MNAVAFEFSGLTTQTVAEIVGHEAARLLIHIDHEHLEHGKNWRWIGGRQVFTESGLELIAGELHARGHTGAAEQLRKAMCYAIAAERAAAARQAPRDWLGKWEETHDIPV